MDRNNYKSISNLKELHSVREELKGAIALKEFELKGEVAACKQALNPVTYLNKIITKLYTMENIIKYFVKGYEFVKGVFSKSQNDIQPDDINNPTNN